MIRILYFASLRERLQTDGEWLTLPAGIDTLATLLDHLRAEGGLRGKVLGADQPLLFAVNQEVARLQTPVQDGDEVAFFPPVTGG